PTRPIVATTARSWSTTTCWCSSTGGPTRSTSWCRPPIRPARGRSSSTAPIRPEPLEPPAPPSGRATRRRSPVARWSCSPAGVARPRSRRSAEVRDHLLAHELDGLHHLLVGDLVGVHQAQQQIDAGLLVLLAHGDALVRRAEQARPRVDEVVEAQ